MRKDNHNTKRGRGGAQANRALALRLAPDAETLDARGSLSEFGAGKVVAFPPSSQGNPARVYVGGLSRSGRRSTVARLQKFASLFGHTIDSFPWLELSPGHCLSARSLLRETGSGAASVNMTLSALRSVARTLRRTTPDAFSAEACAAVVEVEGVRGQGPPAGRALTTSEVAALLQACAADPTPPGVRDLALVALLYSAGLRRDEATRLEPEDYQPRTRALRVLGKGDKEEFVYLEARQARRALSAWMKRRGAREGALLCSLWRGGRVRLDDEGRAAALTGDGIYKIIRRRAREASIAACSPHDLRRSAITHLLEAGKDALSVQAFARHVNLSTTSRYDRRRESAKRSAARLLTITYTRPRPRRPPRSKRRGGRRRRAAALATRPKAQLLALASAHGVEVTPQWTRAKIAAAIEAKSSDGER